MRDASVESTLAFQIDQEQKYQDLVKSYTNLEADWKNMEQYIRGLNDY